MALASSAASPGTEQAIGITRDEGKVILASSLGTVFEWYDFYLYGSLAGVIAKQFFSALSPSNAFIFALLSFSAGFAVRPFGAIVFGRLGDLIGRKHTFLVTILIMGLSTTIVGLLPSYASIGMAAPVVLIALRLLQGLALGGESGGAATYVAEHAPPGKRGLFTSFIQTTATAGLFLSLVVILVCREASGNKFDTFYWRVPFLVSALLLAISVYIRLQLKESPVFRRMKTEGKGSRTPIAESFLRWGNLKVVLLVLFGGVAGQAVVWYTGTFYELFFLTQTLKVDATTANVWVAIALFLAAPFFLFFGWLSDQVGRKWIIMAGCLLAALTYFPIFRTLTRAANPAIFEAVENTPVTVTADPGDCSFQFNPAGTSSFKSSCDIAKAALARRNTPYTNVGAPAGTVASVTLGDTVISSFVGTDVPAGEFRARSTAFDKAIATAVAAGGYPEKADSVRANAALSILMLFLLAFYVTMVYGPIAAWLVELFPTRIRYTSMSLPYHIGNGWFGGFLPPIAFAIVAATGNIYFGLWYPVGVAVMTLVIGSCFMPETKDRDLHG